MIAFDKLIQNIDEYKNLYKTIGFSFNSQKFLNLAEERKKLQLEFESSKAKCNKLCEEFVNLKERNEALDAKIKEINNQNNLTKKLKAKLEHFVEKLDIKLKKLPNVPINNNTNDILLQQNQNSCTLEDFILFLKRSSLKFEQFDGDKLTFFKKNKSILLESDKFPELILCKNDMIIFLEENNFKTIIDKIINHLKINAKSILERSISKISRTSMAEYEIEFENGIYTKLEIVGDYLSREYKIKYRDTNVDLTKFPFQINLVIKKTKQN